MGLVRRKACLEVLNVCNFPPGAAVKRKKKKSLSDSEKISYNIGLCMMVIRNLTHLLLSHLFTMYMTVSLMVIDTQETIAVRKRASPADSRSL